MWDVSIHIHMTGPDADRELGSLYVWLQEEPEVRRHASVSLMSAEPRPSEMGTALEVIQLVVGSGFQALNLALAYAGWRATRPSRPQVIIECDGAKITLDDADPDTIQAIVRAIG